MGGAIGVGQFPAPSWGSTVDWYLATDVDELDEPARECLCRESSIASWAFVFLAMRNGTILGRLGDPDLSARDRYLLDDAPGELIVDIFIVGVSTTGRSGMYSPFFEIGTGRFSSNKEGSYTGQPSSSTSSVGRSHFAVSSESCVACAIFLSKSVAE